MINIAYASIFNARDISQWSGTPFYMSKALEQEGMHIDYIGPLKTEFAPGYKLKQFLKKMTFSQRESPRFNADILKNYSKQVAQQLALLKDTQVILSPTINAVAHLDCKQPIVVWTDAVFASLVAFYSPSSSLSAISVQQGNQATAEALSRSRLALFSSDWAAQSAIELYGVNKQKVKVVPFGANIDCQHNLATIQQMIKSRPRDKVKLLFLGTDWHRKGGNIVFDTAKALHAAGQKVELNFVGCMPPKEIKIPDYIKCHGFISKRTPHGIAKITELLRDSHFLFVPSLAEAYGIVFCEANAYGLPCLTSYVGGISTVVKDNINGMTFSLDSPTSAYCDYICNLMQNYTRYEELALSSFHEYETRLNWKVAAQQVQRLIQEIL